MIREILQIGDTRLERIAEPVTVFDTPALHTLVRDMFDTMRAAHGVGLAAPQIGVNLRIVVFGFEQSERYPDEIAVPDTVLINPELFFFGSMGIVQEDGIEGCLSVPGMRGNVPRYARLIYRAKDIYGAQIEQEVAGFHARIVQHEVDHLDGILYPSRMLEPQELKQL